MRLRGQAAQVQVQAQPHAACAALARGFEPQKKVGLAVETSLAVCRGYGRVLSVSACQLCGKG